MKVDKIKILKNYYQTYDDRIDLLSREVIHPKTKKSTTFGNLMSEAYTKGSSLKKPISKDNVLVIDHIKGVQKDPFTNLRVLDSRTNTAGGGIKTIDDYRKAGALTKEKKFYTKDTLEKISKKTGYSYIKDKNKFFKDQLNLAEDILVKDRNLQKPFTIAKEYIKNLNPSEQKILNQSLKSGFDPTEFAKLFPEQAKALKNIMLKVGTAARALEIPLELAVEGVLMGHAIAGGDTPLEAWRDTLVGYLDPTAYKDGMYRGPKISGADLKDLDLDLSQSARMDTELEKSNEKLQSLKDELEYAESMLNLEGLDERTTSEDYDSLRERIKDEQSRNDYLQEGTSEASREELRNKRINQQDARAAGSAYTKIDKYASELEETTGFSELDYDLRKGIKDVRTVEERNFDTVEDQANFFVNNIPEIKEMYEVTKKNTA